MPTISPQIEPVALRQAWSQLRTSGQASPNIARLLQVGIAQYLEAFAGVYLGPAGLGQGMKLILGANGEGKTHLLYCIQERALAAGHVVSYVEATSSGLGESPFAFAQQILRSMETTESSEQFESRLPALVRASVERKRVAAASNGLDPAPVLLAWARGLRNKDLHPHGVSEALAAATLAAIDEDDEALRSRCAELAFEGVRKTKAEGERDGAQFLGSLPLIVRSMGLGSLVVLVDEAELAIQKQGKQRREKFLKALRFLNDHVANNNRAPCLILTCCSSDFWPEQFQHYEALYQRMVDPGRDSPEERREMKPRALAKSNKLWVSETFRGDLADYQALGTALVELGVRLFPGLDGTVQARNIDVFARAASSRGLLRPVKRYFVKALSVEIESQIDDEVQRECTEAQAFSALDAAVQSIRQADEKSDSGA